jgi:ferrochelatase
LNPVSEDKKRIAVVLFNLGGPDGPADVGPFLLNLFKDPAIIRSPLPVRWLVARLIVRSRTKSAQANYARMGGGSPLLGETKKQAAALEAELKMRGVDAKCFIAMRYWNPLTEDVRREVDAWKPDRTVLLPLYPQFSTTTTESSFKAWGKDAKAIAVCCYPTPDDFIAAHARQLIDTWEKAGKPANIRCLLSAHGLPEQVVRAGDPYQWQVEQTAAALRPHLPPEWEVEICYQSRVGPLKWIGPATDDAIGRAAHDGKAILLSPVAFVSEHIETLVELDEEYAHLAKEAGAKVYLRAPALGVDARFISELAKLVGDALGDSDPSRVRSSCGSRICPADRTACPNRRIAPAAA